MKSKAILYFQPSHLENNRRKMDGVYRYARAAKWRVQVVPYGEAAVSRAGGDGRLGAADIVRLLELWRPDGVIVDCVLMMKPLAIEAFSNVPTVFLGRPRKSGILCVEIDNEAVAATAAKLLLSLDCKSFIYVPHRDNPKWSMIRERTFADILRINGQDCCRLAEVSSRGTQERFRKQIRDALARAPKPVGVFAANDYIAEQALDVARDARMAVPRDVLVVGVDNDLPICENTSPTLTSILPDFDGAGYQAARLLDERMRHPRRALESICISETSVCRRESTNRYRRTSDRVGAAMELIRLRACDGLCARDVIAAMGTSRRLAELRFREVVGTSILSAIQRQRVEQAKWQLQHSASLVADIAARCGYRSVRALRKVFVRETGMSPADWRRQGSH